jgi:hypothetical protein
MAEFTAKSTGRSLQLKKVPLRYVIGIAQREDLKDPDPPTYTGIGAGDVVLTYTHDETTLESADDFKAWKKYQDQVVLQSARRQMEIATFLFYTCVVDDPEPVESWAFDFEMWGLEPPDPADKKTYKVRWIEEEICGGDADDAAALLMLCYSLSGMEAEAIKKIEAFFRSALAG